MTRIECERSPEVLDVLGAGRWPDGCDAELRAHVADCASCTDLVEVAGALLEERDAAFREAILPGSGLVWWRIQLRARREAQRTVSRAAAVVQAIAIVSGLLVALAFLSASSFSGWHEWLSNLADAVTIGSAGFSGLATIAPLGAPILLILAVWLALGPVAIWFAVTDE